MNDVHTLIKSLQANAADLGLTWTMIPGTVMKSGTGLVNVQVDGDESNTITQAISLLGFLPADARVMLLSVPPSTMFVLGLVNTDYPPPGTAIAKLRRDADQTITSGGAGTFVIWDTENYDPFGMWSSGTDLSIPFDGWYLCACRVVWTSNATSRRGCFINKNSTTSGTGTIAGNSIQAPATGSCQVTCSGIELLTTTDVIGVRALQNSGADLTISNTDGGSVLDLIWLGPNIA